MELLRPGVYTQDIANGARPVQGVSTSTGAFVGIAPRGRVGVPTLVTSWTDFCNKFARGLESPYMKESDLAYSMFGFFQNGGSRAYVVRVASGSATRATAEVGADSPTHGGVTFIAKDEGTWANKLKVVVRTNTDLGGFDIVSTLDGEVVEVIDNVYAEEDSDRYFKEVVEVTSNFIEVLLADKLAVGEKEMTGGEDGIDGILDSDYLGDRGLLAFNPIEDINLLVIPGQTSQAINQGILDYSAMKPNCFGIIDLPLTKDTTQVRESRKTLSGEGACYYPWIKVSDPLSKQGRLRVCPTAGHIAGIYARTDSTRGVHKAPAGIEANIRGAVDVYAELANGDIEVLNPVSINCILAKSNIGIVVFGARTLLADTQWRYVPIRRLRRTVSESSRRGTQFTVFEPNGPTLWSQVNSTLGAYLYTVWQSGAFQGSTAEEAFYIKCDAENNPEETQKQGILNVEIGYAEKYPAEFVVLRFTQKTSK